MKHKNKNYIERGFILTLLLGVFCIEQAHGQQNAGDKEFGVSATVSANHGTPFTGFAFAQGSLGKFLSKSRYVGVAAGPQITFGSFTSYSAFASANYRQFKETQNPKFFPFVGVGGGGQFSKAQKGDASVNPNVYGEFGVKSYISQRTSFEIAYNFLYTPRGNGGFGQKTQSLILFSLRHLF
jgi:hypothetical protein